MIFCLRESVRNALVPCSVFWSNFLGITVITLTMLFRTIVTIWLAGNPTVFWTPVNSEADKYSSADDSFEGVFLYPMLNQIMRAFFREHNLYHVMALAVAIAWINCFFT